MAAKPLFCYVDIKRSALQPGLIWGNLWRVDFRRRLLWQSHFELLEQKQEVLFGLGVTSENDFSAVCGGEVHVEHLYGGELFEDGPWSQAAGEGFEAGLEGDLQAVGQERNEDVGFDAVFELVVDGTDGQVAFEFFECLFDFGESSRGAAAR
jgi:hypothetical protein